ncbi:hypothetical protein [Paenibacillus luteus]|nr:hypothetical protein [Paenibacillus luteus]
MAEPPVTIHVAGDICSIDKSDDTAAAGGESKRGQANFDNFKPYE